MVVLTGFQPFGSEIVNPTQRLVKDFDNTYINGEKIQTMLLPVTIKGIESYSSRISDIVMNEEGATVISMGLAGGRPRVAVERVAINCFDFPIEDNDGVQPIDETIVQGGQNAYFSTLPLKRIVAEWNKKGIDGYVSNTAGTYICNGLYYLLLHHLQDTASRVGFVHVPYTNDLAGTASGPRVSYEMVYQAIRTVIETSTNNLPDLKLVGGSVC